MQIFFVVFVMRFFNFRCKILYAITTFKRLRMIRILIFASFWYKYKFSKICKFVARFERRWWHRIFKIKTNQTICRLFFFVNSIFSSFVVVTFSNNVIQSDVCCRNVWIFDFNDCKISNSLSMKKILKVPNIDWRIKNSIFRSNDFIVQFHFKFRNMIFFRCDFNWFSKVSFLKKSKKAKFNICSWNFFSAWWRAFSCKAFKKSFIVQCNDRMWFKISIIFSKSVNLRRARETFVKELDWKLDEFCSRAKKLLICWKKISISSFAFVNRRNRFVSRCWIDVLSKGRERLEIKIVKNELRFMKNVWFNFVKQRQKRIYHSSTIRDINNNLQSISNFSKQSHV